MMRNTQEHWGWPARLLHWSMAALILFQISLGVVAVSLSLSPAKLELFIWHKSLGMLLLLLVLVRLLWRAANPQPALPPHIPRWQRIASRGSDGLLYLCMLALPLSGWVINSAANVPLRVFGWFPLPAIVAPDRGLAEAMKALHGTVVIVLVVVLAVHVGAALHHHYRRRDNVLRRMLRGR